MSLSRKGAQLGLLAGLVAVNLVGSATSASAAVILSPVSAVINAGGPGFGSITNTLDQSGLTSNFVSGVTDFDAYLATNPTHTWIFAGFEWFSNQGTNSASVTYDLGAVYDVGGIALWNEESSGVGLVDLLGSTDGIAFAALGSLAPTDHSAGDFNYPADVLKFASQNVRYVRLDMSRCPQPDSDFDACAVGEVAFAINQVPEPGLLSLIGLGLVAASARRRNRI